MSWPRWKAFEKEVAAFFGGLRAVRVDYAESIGDVVHDRLGIECKYGNQVPGYVKVDVLTIYEYDNNLYVACPASKMKDGRYVIAGITYKILKTGTFLKKGLGQASGYAENKGKIPVLCCKPQRFNSFVVCCRLRDFFHLCPKPRPVDEPKIETQVVKRPLKFSRL
jgi:hypothetical protein